MIINEKLSDDKIKQSLIKYVKDNIKNISSNGQLISDRHWSYLGISNDKALDIINTLGLGKFKFINNKEPSTIWTNGASINKTYLKKVG